MQPGLLYPSITFLYSILRPKKIHNCTDKSVNLEPLVTLLLDSTLTFNFYSLLASNPTSLHNYYHTAPLIKTNHYRAIQKALFLFAR